MRKNSKFLNLKYGVLNIQKQQGIGDVIVFTHSYSLIIINYDFGNFFGETSSSTQTSIELGTANKIKIK